MLEMGVHLDFDLSFLVTLSVAIFLFTRFEPLTFRYLLTKSTIRNCLFPFLSKNIRLEGLFLFFFQLSFF